MSGPVADVLKPAPMLLLRGAGFERALNRGEYRIKCDPSADIVLNGRRVPRRHAVLRAYDGARRVEDSGGLNGTWLGSERTMRSRRERFR